MDWNLVSMSAAAEKLDALTPSIHLFYEFKHAKPFKYIFLLSVFTMTCQNLCYVMVFYLREEYKNAKENYVLYVRN